MIKLPQLGLLVIMTTEDHDALVVAGCDPHCHACGVKVEVDDSWGMKTFAEPAESMLDMRINGLCCEECMKSDRKLSAVELEGLLVRFRTLTAGAVIPAPATTPPKPGTHAGCFALDDGTIF